MHLADASELTLVFWLKCAHCAAVQCTLHLWDEGEEEASAALHRVGLSTAVLSLPG